MIGTADTSQRWVQGLYLEGSAGASGAEAPLYKLLLGVVNQDAHSAPLSPNRTMSASLSFPPSAPLSQMSPVGTTSRPQTFHPPT